MSRSRKCLFVGYPQGKNGWKLNDLETGGYFVSRDVKFYETNFPFAHNIPPLQRILLHLILIMLMILLITLLVFVHIRLTMFLLKGLFIGGLLLLIPPVARG